MPLKRKSDFSIAVRAICKCGAIKIFSFSDASACGGSAMDSRWGGATACHVAPLPQSAKVFVRARMCRSFDEILRATCPARRGPPRWRATDLKLGPAMITSPRRDRRARAIAEMLAMIADAHPKTGREWPRPSCTTNEELMWEDATEFSAALERLFASHQHRYSGKLTPRGRTGILAPWLQKVKERQPSDGRESNSSLQSIAFTPEQTINRLEMADVDLGPGSNTAVNILFLSKPLGPHFATKGNMPGECRTWSICCLFCLRFLVVRHSAWSSRCWYIRSRFQTPISQIEKLLAWYFVYLFYPRLPHFHLGSQVSS
jgi:hypothetical protein